MKHIFRYILPAAAVMAATLAGCSTIKNMTGSKSPAPTTTGTEQPKTGAEMNTGGLNALQTEDVIDSVIRGKWIIADAGGKAVGAAHDELERPYITFDSTAVNPFILKFYAYTGCNMVNGSLALTKENKISKIGELAATMRACPDDAAEPAIINAINTAASYRIERVENNYILYFYNDANTNTMVMRKNDMGFLDGAWDVKRIPPITINDDDMPEPMRLVFDMTEGRLHGNTGCNVLNAGITTSIEKRNSITITNPATTRMACPNAGLEQQLVNALGKVAKAQKGKHGTVDLLDSAGNTVIVLAPAKL